MRYYYQKDEVNNFVDEFVFSAYLGQKELDYEGVSLTFKNIKEVPVSDDVMIIGYVEDTLYYLNQLGIDASKPMNIPNDLLKYTNREIKFPTLGEIRNDPHSFIPGFLKTNQIVKATKAGLLKRVSSITDFFYELGDDHQFLWSEPINIETEYRVFVYKNEIVGIRHYQGDFCKFIDSERVKEMINTFNFAPVAYTLDVGLYNNETVIVECNAAFSTASYGLDYEIYFKFLKAGWLNLISKF